MTDYVFFAVRLRYMGCLNSGHRVMSFLPAQAWQPGSGKYNVHEYILLFISLPGASSGLHNTLNQ